MKKNILLNICLAVLTSVALAGPGEKVKAKIEKMNKAMSESMVSGDYNSTLDMNAPDVISMPNYAPMIQGIEAIKKSNEEMSMSGMKVSAFNLNIKDIWSEGDMYIEIGTYTMDFTIGDNPKPMNDKGKYLTVWEKDAKGELKVKASIWNTDINPWANQ